MMVAAPRLSESLQALVDLRLDTIDRMLLDRVPRQDRVNIVGEVEAQIFELLEQRGVEEPGRDDVLAVLSRIDPPEAYVPEGSERRVASESPRVVATLSSSMLPKSAGTPIARTSGILGLVSVFGLPVAVLIMLVAALTESELILLVGLFGIAGLMLLGGLAAIVLAGCARLRGAWSVVGLAAGSFSVLVSLMGALFLLENA